MTTSVASYKRYKKGHDDFALLAAAAVKKGHLAATALLELDTRVPSLPSAIDKHLSALSFFRKDRSYTAADVERVRKNYDAAAAWFAGKLPGLRKQAKGLHGSHDFVPGALSSAAKAYRDSFPDRTSAPVNSRSFSTRSASVTAPGSSLTDGPRARNGPDRDALTCLCRGRRVGHEFPPSPDRPVGSHHLRNPRRPGHLPRGV